ncbi:MAG: hypothetical protein L3J16_01050 [Anaerolineales bacterium]|nr:hypothetical protein [Anaerolineales bacterium]
MTAQQIEKFAEIREKLSLRKWRDATLTSSFLIETILQGIHRKVLENTNLRKQEKLFAHPQKGMPQFQPFAKMTLGQRLRVIREYDLFTLYEDITKEDLTLLKNMNWNAILATRNSSVHAQEIPVTEKDALLVSSSLFLIALQVTDWKPADEQGWWERMLQNLWFKRIFATVCFVLVAWLGYFVWNLVPLAHNADILQTKYGRELAEVVIKRDDYSLAIWLAQGDKSVKDRERFLYNLYVGEAERISTSDPLEAYRYYEKALGYADEAFELEATKKWQTDILLAAQDELLDEMTRSDQFRAKYGSMQATYRTLTR